jgi:hypothetical protein
MWYCLEELTEMCVISLESLTEMCVISLGKSHGNVCDIVRNALRKYV